MAVVPGDPDEGDPCSESGFTDFERLGLNVENRSAGRVGGVHGPGTGRGRCGGRAGVGGLGGAGFGDPAGATAQARRG
ncbi:hypothetical protein EKG83_10080 [Saccharothrix syringae]|uniref:Uncharacterized protein n=1 Tax=Saccharothrix syringae TaxID=103733 RepID=A0A5Q0GV34_SACSY|nr:hypothetical protein EKG83_10080 [Saccharothrix syringae]